MPSDLLAVAPVVYGERVSKADIENCNCHTHDLIDASKVHRQEVGRVKQVHCAHDHGEICGLIAVELLHG